MFSDKGTLLQKVFIDFFKIFLNNYVTKQLTMAASLHY